MLRPGCCQCIAKKVYNYGALAFVEFQLQGDVKVVL